MGLVLQCKDGYKSTFRPCSKTAHLLFLFPFLLRSLISHNHKLKSFTFFNKNLPMPQSAKQGASKSKGNPGRPHYLGGFEIETGLSKEEMNDWVNEVVDRIEKSEQSEHPQIWTKRRGHRHSFAVNVTEQQAILIIRRWLKQDFFTISHYLSNWDDVYGLRARNFKGNVRIAFEAYEVGAVYLFLLTYGPYLGPGVATLAPWIPSKEFEFPDHKGAAVLCPGMKECPSMPYSEAKEYLGEHRMPESAARYTAEILKNKVYVYCMFSHLLHANTITKPTLT